MSRKALMTHFSKGRWSETFMVAIAILFSIGFRFYEISEIRERNPEPIELDDALSYLMHGTFLLKDPAHTSNTLSSFSDLEFVGTAKHYYDWSSNRQHHRIKYFYHKGHAFLVAAIHTLTRQDFIDIWWNLTYIFNFLLIVILAMLISHLHSKELAAFSVLLYGPCITIVFHQLTAAPREWATLGFLFSFYYFSKIIEIKKIDKLTFLNLSMLILSSFVMYSFHTIGLLYLFFISVLAIFSFYFGKRNISLYALCFSAIALSIMTTKFLMIGFNVSSEEGQKAQLAIQNYGLGNLKSYINLSYLETMPLIFGNITRSIYLAIFVCISCVFGFYISVRDILKNRNKLLKFRSQLLLVSVIGMFTASLTLEFMGIEYAPITDFFLVGSYLSTLKLLGVTILLAHSILYFVTRLKPGIIKVFVTISLCASVPIIHNSQLEQQITKLSKKAAGNPIALLQKIIQSDSFQKNPCIMIQGEKALYYFLTYGDYNAKVYYQQSCSNTGYTNFGYFPNRESQLKGEVKFHPVSCPNIFGLFGDKDLNDCIKLSNAKSNHKCSTETKLGSFTFARYDAACNF